MQSLPRIALTTGDPAGIGPEIVNRALEQPELAREVRLLAIGPELEAPTGIPVLERIADWNAESGHAWLRSEGKGGWRKGEASVEGGRAALGALRAGVELATRDEVEALVTAPVSKEGLHLAGERVEGQTQLLHRWSKSPRVEMLACARRLRVMLLTRHVPLVQALAEIDGDLVYGGLCFLHGELERLGVLAPRIALAGFNPHASEGGLFGDEESVHLEPACEKARARGVNVHGPLPADSVFARAAGGEFDAVLALYHDQGFIPIKLHAPDEASTLLLGLPYVRVSPAHGTAYDIAGKGLADSTPLIHSIRQALTWVQRSIALT